MKKKHKHCIHEVSFIGSISDDDPIECANRIDRYIRDFRRKICCVCGQPQDPIGEKA